MNITIPQYFLELEIRSIYNALLELTDPQTAMQITQKNTLRHRMDEAWKHEINTIALTQPLITQRLPQLVTYYHHSGMGINKICKALNTSQHTVYQILESPPIDYPSPVMNMLLDTNPEIPDNLEWLLTKFNPFHGNIARPKRQRQRREFPKP